LYSTKARERVSMKRQTIAPALQGSLARVRRYSSPSSVVRIGMELRMFSRIRNEQK
jgi:hypothetical protein